MGCLRTQVGPLFENHSNWELWMDVFSPTETHQKSMKQTQTQDRLRLPKKPLYIDVAEGS